MAKFVFKEAVCGDNRSYSLPYYNWLCMELIRAHSEFLRNYHDRDKLHSSNSGPVRIALETLRQEAYEDYTAKHEEEFLNTLAKVREAFRSENLTSVFQGKPSSRARFESYVEELTGRIRRDSEKANWLSNLVQSHFHAFAVRPMTQFSLAAISYQNSDPKNPAHESMFYTLAELRDRAFRDPSKERIERYLKKVELIRVTSPYKRLRYLSNQLTDGATTVEVQGLEDELMVALMWNELTVQH
jgi:hypothetical protein